MTDYQPLSDAVVQYIIEGASYDHADVLALVHEVKHLRGLLPVCPTCHGKPWKLHTICCGRDDNTTYRATWEEVEAIRASYVTADGHERDGIISQCACVGGRMTVEQVVACSHTSKVTKAVER